MSTRTTLALLFSRSDEAAMCRVKDQDDDREFARLVKRWEGSIQRLCTRMIGDPDRADDLKQEVFIRLFANRKTYQPKSRFSTFLWRIALNRCYDELRRQRRCREFLDCDPEESPDREPVEAAQEARPDLQTASLEESDLVRQAVLALPEIYRAVVVLRHYEGLKLARIAEVLEIPEGTVNSRMAEALDRLSRALGPKLQRESLPQKAERSPTTLPCSGSDRTLACSLASPSPSERELSTKIAAVLPALNQVCT